MELFDQSKWRTMLSSFETALSTAWQKSFREIKFFFATSIRSQRWVTLQDKDLNISHNRTQFVIIDNSMLFVRV